MWIRLTWGSGLWPLQQPQDTDLPNWPVRIYEASSAGGDWRHRERRGQSQIQIRPHRRQCQAAWRQMRWTRTCGQLWWSPCSWSGWIGPCSWESSWRPQTAPAHPQRSRSVAFCAPATCGPPSSAESQHSQTLRTNKGVETQCLGWRGSWWWWGGELKPDCTN